MQFGRIFGLGLIVLGIVLCVFQFVHMAPPGKGSAVQPETRAETKPEHIASSLPGIIGAGSLVAGIVLFATARRKDEPDPQYKVK